MVASSVSLEKVASDSEVNGTMLVNSESFYVDMRVKTSQAASEVIEVGASHTTSNEEVISATETNDSEVETTKDYHGNVMSMLPTSNSNFPIIRGRNPRLPDCPGQVNCGSGKLNLSTACPMGKLTK